MQALPLLMISAARPSDAQAPNALNQQPENDWFFSNRIQAHTRLSLIRHGHMAAFQQAGALFRASGAQVFTRHVKTSDEAAWWPSAHGKIHPVAKQRNIAAEIISEAHANGCRIIAYYRHMEDRAMAQQHPDWLCRDWRGRTIGRRRGDYLCFNSPYADFVLLRLQELAAMGADGFYFDSVHMPKSGCWCRYCRERFTQATGLKHPNKRAKRDPVWHALIDFNNQSIVSTFNNWQRALKSRYPGLVLLIGSHHWPTLCDRHTNNRLYRYADSVKTEFTIPIRRPKSLHFPCIKKLSPMDREQKVALGYILARDAAQGQPAHVWLRGLPETDIGLYAVAGVLTHGCIANIDVKEETIDGTRYPSAFALGQRLSTLWQQAQPLRWLAIHFPEQARDAYIRQPQIAWEKILQPLHDAYGYLHQRGVPTSIITDSLLEDGFAHRYQALYLPYRNGLSANMDKQIQAFQDQGGRIVEQLASVMDLSPIRVLSSHQSLHIGAYLQPQQQRLLILLANAFTWVSLKHPKKAAVSVQTEPAPCRDARLIIRWPNRPTVATEILTQQPLPLIQQSQAYQIDIPEFRYLAAISVALQPVA